MDYYNFDNQSVSNTVADWACSHLNPLENYVVVRVSQTESIISCDNVIYVNNTFKGDTYFKVTQNMGTYNIVEVNNPFTVNSAVQSVGIYSNYGLFSRLDMSFRFNSCIFFLICAFIVFSFMKGVITSAIPLLRD